MSAKTQPVMVGSLIDAILIKELVFKSRAQDERNSSGGFMNKMFASVAFSLALGASAAHAAGDPVATLAEIGGKGRVLVNQGEEFVPAAEGMSLRVGDRIMVQDDSSAEIKYGDGCESGVSENKIVTITDKSSCSGGTPIVQELNPSGGSAIGATGATGTGNGGVWVMVGVVAAIDLWWLNEDDNETVSP